MFRMRSFLLVVGVASSPLACGPPPLDCVDRLPPGDATYSRVSELVIGPGPGSCSGCHNTESPLNGYNFEGPGVAYDALTAKREATYATVASGRMPKGGPAWSEEQKRLLRSWYCDGALYAP